MSQNAAYIKGGSSGIVDSITATNGITVNQPTGNVTVSGVNALADGSTVGVSTFNATEFSSSTPGIITSNAIAVSLSGGLTGSTTVNLGGTLSLVGSSPSLPISIPNGGTGASTAPTALSNLGALPIAGGTMTGNLILNADPVTALGASTKQYVDSAIASVNPPTSVYSASTTNIPGTYTSVASGIGDTFLTTATGTFSVDGVSPPVLSRILLKDQSTTLQNGVYVLTTNGTGITGTLFTRALDYDQPSDINNTGIISVLNGTLNAGTGWIINVTVSSVGADPITFTQFIFASSSFLANNALLGFYGDGSDGSVTFDGSATILGIAPSSSTYTLNRDIFLASSTINNAVSIITNSYRIYCNGTLTNNGTIQYNGHAGTNTGTQGAAVTNSSGSISQSVVGSAGGAGNTGAGSIGVAAARAYGGTGGNGGAGASGGGNGGTITAPTPLEGSIRSFVNSSYGFLAGATSSFNIVGGAGGGGGGGDAVNKGGGGGSGAGIVLLVVYLFAGTGSINAIGGNGGAGSVGATNAGGGGGGGGGLILIISRSIVSSAISGQTLSAAGGNFGAGTGLGSVGLVGNPGISILFPF